MFNTTSVVLAFNPRSFCLSDVLLVNGVCKERCTMNDTSFMLTLIQHVIPNQFWSHFIIDITIILCSCTFTAHRFIAFRLFSLADLVLWFWVWQVSLWNASWIIYVMFLGPLTAPCHAEEERRDRTDSSHRLVLKLLLWNTIENSFSNIFHYFL